MSNRTPVPERFRQSEPMLTEPQHSFICGLIDERDLSSLDEGQIAYLEAFKREDPDISMPSKQKASEIISKLVALPKTPKAKRVDLPDLPAGRYAVENEAGELRFYKLDKPTEGRWAGRVFLSVLASDEKHPIKNMTTKKAIMDKIALDPQGAMNRYGEEIGSCGVCGRTLTNQDSRARGIGPICAAKYREDYGWWS